MTKRGRSAKPNTNWVAETAPVAPTKAAVDAAAIWRARRGTSGSPTA